MDKTRLSQLGQRSDRVRLLVLTVLMVIITAIWFWTEHTSDLYTEVPDASLRPAAEENAQPAAEIDFELLRDVREATRSDRLTVEHDPFLHLLIEAGKAVPGDFRRLGSRRIDPELHDAILANPAEYRGQAFYAKALFTWAEPAGIQLSPGDSRSAPPLTYYRGLAQTDDGRRFSFSVLEEPRDLREGQVVRIEGFFFKPLALVRDAADAPVVDGTLHLVGKRVVPSYLRLEPVTQLDLNIMETVRDHELDEQQEIPEGPLFHALSFLQNVDADVLSEIADDRTSAALRNDPERYRGHPVRVLGTFREMWARELGESGENPLEVNNVWHGLLVHYGPTFTYLISLDREPQWMKPGTNVIAEGIFFKRYTYLAKNGEVVPCALMLVKRFLPFTVDTAPFRNVMAAVFIGITAVLAIWLFLTSRSDREAEQEFRKRYYARRRARVTERLGKPPPPDAGVPAPEAPTEEAR